MKRKQDAEYELLEKLEKNIEKLLHAAQRLAGAADKGRRQIDRLNQLIAHAEEIFMRHNKRGISLQGDDLHQACRPIDLPPETDNDEQGEYFVNYGFGHFVEFSSYEELKRFQKMPPISGDDIELCDLDETIRRLLSDDENNS
jgi:hypothetical protein